MFGSTTFLPVVLALSALSSTAGASSSPHHANHQLSHAKRFGKVARNSVVEGRSTDGSGLAIRDGDDKKQLSKRAFSGRATFFAPGLGACGTYSSASDYMVALNADQYGDMGAVSSWCFQTITISYGGKSAQATVLDACPSCPYGGLDMSPSLFTHFASEDVGVFYMSWVGGSGGGEQTTTTTEPEPTTTTRERTTTTEWTPEPTTTWTPEPTTTTTTEWTPSTTTWTPEPTTTTTEPPSTTTTTTTATTTTTTTSTSTTTSRSTTSSSTSSSSSSSRSSTTSSSSSTTSSAKSSSSSSAAAAAATPSLGAGGNLDSLSQLVLAMGGLANAAVEAAQA